MLLALLFPAYAGILINEVVYDPSGSDDGAEWIELCNDGSSTVDLTGYVIENAGSSWGDVYTFSSGTLAPGEYLLVGSGSSTHSGSFDPNLQNGGSQTDGLRLVDSGGTTVDTVLYDEPNSSLTEDDGSTPAAGASAATSGKSLGRWPDCSDTNVSATDFVVYATSDVSPGAVNADPDSGSGGDDTGGGGGSTADCTGSDGIVINELMPNPDGSDSGLEWLEIKNNGSATVTLDGWLVEWGTGDYGDHEWEFPAGTTLGAGEYLVVGEGGLDASLSLGNAGSNADGVRVTCDGAAVDSVIYGESNSDGFADDSGATATSLAPEPTEGESLQRLPDGTDTDACAVDFASGAATPGAANTDGPVGDADCTGSEDVVINELCYSTDEEWIEIYNGGSGAVTLDGWLIEFGTSSYNKEAEIPDGTTLAAGGWIVVGSSGAATKDVELDLDLGNASDTDAVRLTCNTLPVDTVLYGDPNDNAWTDDTGEVATSLAPSHGDGESIARIQDGFDTDQCGDDFALSESPTPGAANPYSEPPRCVVDGADGLKINEFLYDPDSTDTGQEWIELYNAGSSAIALDDYVIETATSDWTEDFRFPGGVDLQPGAFVVIGGEYVDAADYLAEDLSLGNGTRADGIRVLDCEGTVLDTVLYGDELDDPISGDGGSLEVVPGTSESATLGRYPDGEDSDAAADWHPYSEPTPGEPNTDPGAGGGGGGTETGCGGNPPPPGGGGCTTVLPFGGFEVGLAALALVRRRRLR